MRADQRQVAVVANPAGAAEESEELRAALEARGVQAEWAETTEDDPGRGQAATAVRAGADLVIACGGDGTVRACIEAVAGTEATLAVVPAGTGNLLARNLGLPLDDVEAALDCALGGRTRRIDIGYVNDEAFAVMAGAGLDAVIMEDTSRTAKNTFGALAYVATALKHLHDRRFGVEIEIDQRTAYVGPATTVLVGNMGKLQGGIDLFPDAEPNNGSLGVLAVNPSSLADWVKTGWAVFRGRNHTTTLDRWAATSGVITLERPRPYQVDGEERDETTRLAFRVESAALEVCVPEDAR